MSYLTLRRFFLPHDHPLLLPMHSSATFCKIPLSTSVNPLSKCSLVSLDWILTSGIPAPQSFVSGVLTLPSGNGVCSMNVKLSVTTSIPYDLVLGRDWLLFCRETLPHASFRLSSGIFYPGQQPTASSSYSAHPAPNTAAMDTGAQISVTAPSLVPGLPLSIYIRLYAICYTHDYNVIFESIA
ncbi:hypothetical protein FB451DRAFT_1494995 [Mycena latifolia]|nr:hypothetical protein FB451DRAFT_1494995 [Mycena latifolia]